MPVPIHDPKGPVRLRVGTAADIALLEDIDRDAGDLFVRAGLDLNLPSDHEFLAAERGRWIEALQAGRVLLACLPSGKEVGFVASGLRDGAPFLEQISVRMSAMRRGVGSTLLAATEQQARECGGQFLWLTTYVHLLWNRPLYERRGFVLVSELECGPAVRRQLQSERRWLPSPENRVVMLKTLTAASRLPLPVS